MNHFAITCVLLQHTHRSLSAHQIKKLGKLSHRPFQKSKKEFILPTKHLIALSRKQPVRLILDYVLISRPSEEITFPFNYVLNPNTRRLEPTMFILFVVAEIEGRLYPIHLDFWAQEEWAEGDSLYLTKLDVAKAAILQLHAQGLEISEVLFDAGFSSRALLEDLATLEIPYVCRFSRSWNIETQTGILASSAKLFTDNRAFYYDRHKECFLAAVEGRFAGHAVKLVAIANSRQKLDTRRYYCLLTNQTELKHTEIFRHYIHRGQIEWFFKMLKSYLGMLAFHRHHPDECLIPHFQMRCAAFVLLQAYARGAGMTLFKVLQTFRELSQAEIQFLLQRYWDEWGKHLVKASTDPSDLAQTLTEVA